MNIVDEKFNQNKIVEEMLSVIDIIKEFNIEQTRVISKEIENKKRIVLTGEGSSRIFPAKNAIRKALKWDVNIPVFTEGAHQASQYNLDNSAVLCASNSGRTKEVMLLIKQLKSSNTKIIGFTNNSNTPLEAACEKTFKLKCGYEKAFAATKSIIEQALFYDSIMLHLTIGNKRIDMNELSEKVKEALTIKIEDEIIQKVSHASNTYFAGYNDGVAEELTLKTNEILSKKSNYLEGTYAVHGVEEIMTKDEVVILVDPIKEEIEKYKEVLVDGVGMHVIAISNYETPFPTILVPDAGDFSGYVFLTAGWNLLIDVGLNLGLDINDAQVARKVGNEIN